MKPYDFLSHLQAKHGDDALVKWDHGALDPAVQCLDITSFKIHQRPYEGQLFPREGNGSHVFARLDRVDPRTGILTREYYSRIVTHWSPKLETWIPRRSISLAESVDPDGDRFGPVYLEGIGAFHVRIVGLCDRYV